MDGPTPFKSAYDWRTGDPKGLWPSDGILKSATERELAEICRKYAEDRNLS